MTARFLLHLRDWEHQATSKSEFSHRGSGAEINFKKTTVCDDELDDYRENNNGNGNRNNSGHGWSIHDEFGNDPVLEARMGYDVSKDEKANLGEIETSSIQLVSREKEVCVASSSTPIHGLRV